MIIFVDIDNTICITKNGDYRNSIPLPKQIAKINRMYDEDHTIIYWTARGGTTGIDWTDFTEKQLIKWGCKFHSVSLDKSEFDIIIDDKARRIDECS